LLQDANVISRAFALGVFVLIVAATAAATGHIHGFFLRLVCSLSVLWLIPAVALAITLRALFLRRKLDEQLCVTWGKTLPAIPIGVSASSSAVTLSEHFGISGHVSPVVAATGGLFVLSTFFAELLLWRVLFDKMVLKGGDSL
jgi:hypothetical protein